MQLDPFVGVPLFISVLVPELQLEISVAAVMTVMSREISSTLNIATQTGILTFVEDFVPYVHAPTVLTPGKSAISQL